jgi:uncharacterized membrane protein YGL010W
MVYTHRMFQLDAEWTDLMHRYEERHRDPRNRRCHLVGIPLIAASVPVGATVVGLPLAASMLAVGSCLQAIGHACEGKRPAFVDDRRNVIVGLLWWLDEVGLSVKTTEQGHVGSC